MTLRRRLVHAGIVLGIVVFLGVVGYLVIEPQYGFLDAVYMTVITLGTVGFHEVHPLSSAGRIFTIFLIIGGSGTLLYGLSTATAFIVEGEFTDLLRRRRMEKHIVGFTGHYIICGLGGAGRYVAEELLRTRRPFVAVDSEVARCKMLPAEDRIAWIIGDPTAGDTLRAAGIDRASGFVSALDSDKDNVFAVLTARDMNARLRIVALAVEPDSVHKLRVAGADEVVQPYMIGGLRMASVLIRPAVVTFLDTMLRGQDPTLRVEEIPVTAGAVAEGRTLGQLTAIAEANVLVVALRHPDGRYEFNPRTGLSLVAGDVLVVMGEVPGIERLRKQYGSMMDAAAPAG